MPFSSPFWLTPNNGLLLNVLRLECTRNYFIKKKNCKTEKWIYTFAGYVESFIELLGTFIYTRKKERTNSIVLLVLLFHVNGMETNWRVACSKVLCSINSWWGFHEFLFVDMVFVSLDELLLPVMGNPDKQYWKFSNFKVDESIIHKSRRSCN